MNRCCEQQMYKSCVDREESGKEVPSLFHHAQIDLGPLKNSEEHVLR